MSYTAPAPDTVLEVINTLAPPGTPLTTQEVADEFDCSSRTIYNKLDALVDEDVLKTKKVGARGRVWWQPIRRREYDELFDSTPLVDDRRAQQRNTERADSATFDRLLQFLDATLFTIRDQVCVWNRENQVVHANESLEERWGVDADDYLGRTMQELGDPLGLSADLEQPIKQVFETGNPVSGKAVSDSEVRTDSMSGSGTFEYTLTPIYGEDGSVEFVVGVTRDSTACTEAETDLRARRQLQEERDMFADGPTVVFRWDPDSEEGWPVEYVSENVEDVLGYTPEELESGDIPYSDLLFDEELDRIAREVAEHSDGTTKRFSHEPYRIKTKDGDYRWVKDTTKIIRDETGTITNYLGYLLDITERKHTQAALERLNGVSRELMNADTQEITDCAAEITRDVLTVEYAELWCYKGTSGELDQHSSVTNPETDFGTVHLPDGFTDRIWQTFLGDDVNVYNDITNSEGTPSERHVQSAVLIPLGRHGVICAGATQTASFDRREIDLAETVAATIEAALDRAEGEQRLADQNKELHRLDQLNSLIRGIDKVLVEADSLEAIDQAVCERLTNSDHFEFAWIGERDPVTETVTPREWAGVDSGYLENLEITVDETPTDDPIATAARTGELQVVSDIAIDPRAAAWREATLERDARSCISIPLVYDGSVYGVLTVYIDYPQPDELYHTVLEELGETIAYAIDAAETKRALLTDDVTELTLKTRNADDVLADLATQVACEIEFDGLVPQSDGAIYLFFTTRTTASEDVLAAATQLPGIAEIEVIRDEGSQCVFGATITESTLASHIIDNNGFVHSLTVTDDATTVVVDLPTDVTVREFVETVQRVYSGTELIARRTRDRPIKTRHDLRDALAEQLTERQQEILKTAYMSGFFESPRVRTGQQLSEALDITQSTFSHHLREAERRLCELVFENP